MRSIRNPAAAGSFYPSSREALKDQIIRCFTSKIGPGKPPKLNPSGKRDIIALISPHAGYPYSGPVAAHGFYSLAEDGKPDIIILLGPNHTGIGSGVSLMSSGTWRTPLGDVKIDSSLSEEILRRSLIIDRDESAHLLEHSLEVQIPFLQFVLGEFKIVPICMMMQDIHTSMEVGNAIAESVKDRNVLIIASTDLTHYEPQKSAEKKDKAVIDAILSLNEKKLEKVIYERSISMCGPGPVLAAIRASKLLGAKRAELLKYATSGDVTGDYSAVVGYSSIKIVR